MGAPLSSSTYDWVECACTNRDCCYSSLFGTEGSSRLTVIDTRRCHVSCWLQLPLPLPDPLLASEAFGLPAWLDIETTGFSPRTSHATLIGYLLPVERGRELVQTFVETPEEEADVLLAAFDVLEHAALVITFNGQRFDVPFLVRRSAVLGVRMPRFLHRDLLADADAWDPARRIVPDHRLQSLMRHFGLHRTDEHDGRDMVFAYRRWLDRRPSEDRQFIVDHNADDLLRLPELTVHLLGGQRGA